MNLFLVDTNIPSAPRYEKDIACSTFVLREDGLIKCCKFGSEVLVPYLKHRPTEDLDLKASIEKTLVNLLLASVPERQKLKSSANWDDDLAAACEKIEQHELVPANILLHPENEFTIGEKFNLNLCFCDHMPKNSFVLSAPCQFVGVISSPTNPSRISTDDEGPYQYFGAAVINDYALASVTI